MRLLRAPNPSDSVGRVVLRALVAVFLSAGGLAGPMSPARAAITLEGSIAPGTGPNLYDFSADYASSSPPRNALAVEAQFAGPSSLPPLDLIRTDGDPRNGTWSASRVLPTGAWQVTFVATVENADHVTDVVSIVVQDPPTPPPPTPTPPPTPRPTPTPTLPPGATPRPPTPRPTPTPTLRPGETPRPTPTLAPGQTQAPTVGASLEASADPSSTDPSSTDRASPAPSDGAASGSAGATGSPRPEPASGETDADERGFVSTPWLVLGGGLSAVGAGVIVVNWVVNRRRVGPAP